MRESKAVLCGGCEVDLLEDEKGYCAVCWEAIVELGRQGRLGVTDKGLEESKARIEGQES